MTGGVASAFAQGYGGQARPPANGWHPSGMRPEAHEYDEAIIAPEWRARLHDYLGETVPGLGGFPEDIGGVADHVHLLVGLKATHCLSDFMRELKKASSTWAHDELGLRAFAWQEGYAAFTVSATARERVKHYIANQEEHHRVKSFREELIEMLTSAGIEYDGKYLD